MYDHTYNSTQTTTGRRQLNQIDNEVGPNIKEQLSPAFGTDLGRQLKYCIGDGVGLCICRFIAHLKKVNRLIIINISDL